MRATGMIGAAGSPVEYEAQMVAGLRASVLRRMALTVAVGAWIAGAPLRVQTQQAGFYLCLVVTCLALACLWLARTHFAGSAALFLSGLCVLGILAAWLYPGHPVVFFLSMVVAAGVFLRGPLAGIVLAAAITGGLALVAHLTPALAGSRAVAGAVLAWLALAFSWQGTQPMATLISWSWHSYAEARQRASQLEERQGKLNQVLKDLDNAYQELARANERLSLSNAVANEARQAKAEFVANVSHELRTPINMIVGFTEMIVRNPRAYARQGLPARLLADLDVVLRNAQHLSGLINDVLDLSQIDVARMGLVKEWSSLPDIARAAVSSIEPLAHTRGLEIGLEVENGLPPILIDRTRVRQVLLNLLSNAARFTEAGGIRVRVWREDSTVVTAVSDTGPGIRSEDIPKLFEPFRQLDGSLRRRYGGTGLGLHISRRFVALHGGEMTVQSQLGQGTTIRFTLPIEDTVPFAPLQKSAGSAPGIQPAAPPYVVVEPRPVIGNLLERYLDNCTVMAAASLEEAAEVSRAQATSGIILRATHRQEAWRLLERAESLEYGAPLMACSLPGALEAYTQELGLAGYLLKPVTQEQVLEALAQLPHARTVMIVDDNRDFLRLFAGMLRSARARYTVWQAASGEEALALLQSRRPDAIFLDVLLPDVDGPALLKRIREQEALQQIPVFFITAQDTAGSPLVANFMGIAHHGGLSADELVRSIKALGEALRGAIPPADRERQEAAPG